MNYCTQPWQKEIYEAPNLPAIWIKSSALFYSLVRAKELFSKNKGLLKKINNSSQGNLGQVFHMVSRSLCCGWRHNVKLFINVLRHSALQTLWQGVELVRLSSLWEEVRSPPHSPWTQRHTYNTTGSVCGHVLWPQLMIPLHTTPAAVRVFSCLATQFLCLCLTCSSFLWKEMGAFQHGALAV